MNILIVEDVTLIAERISRLAQEYLNHSIDKIIISHTLEDAESLILEHVFDLVFLDLNLNGKNGFSLLEKKHSCGFKTIVITANKAEAAHAYDLGIFDFISKPITKDRFKTAIERLQRSDNAYVAEAIVIKNGNQVSRIPLEDIIYIKASGHYSDIFCNSGRKLLHDRNLERTLSQLPSTFQRVHRSYIIDTRKIETCMSCGGGKYMVQLSDGTELPISKLFFQSYKSGEF